MYCGDETGSFIGEIGSHGSRFGYGGDDSPKYVVPSYMGVSPSGSSTANKAVRASCYNHRWASQECRAPLRMVQAPASGEPVVNPAHYLSQGDQIEDWDAYEQLWQSAFDTLHVRDQLKHTTGGKEGEGKCNHPLLVVAPGCTHMVGSSTGTAAAAAAHRKQMTQITELMMETMQCPSMFVAPAPMLAAFCHGRQTALVVDIGAGGTRVTPVVEGLLLRQAQRRSGRGGDWMGNVQWKALLEQKTVIRPRYQVTGNSVIPQGKGIFHRWAMNDLMAELRTCEYATLPNGKDPATPLFPENERNEQKDEEESEGENNDDEDGEDAVIAKGESNDDNAMDIEQEPPAVQDPGNNKTFELPDGTLLDLNKGAGPDLCRTPELLFCSPLPFVREDASAQSILDEHASLSNAPIQDLIHSSLSAVGDIDARKDLASNILITGGSSLFRGLEERVAHEVSVNATYKTKVVASKYNVERSYASWIGGSILTSLGSFQQLWLGRTEYDEYGATLAIQRFP